MTEDELERLNAAYGREGAVAFRTSPLGGPVVALTHGAANVEVALFGGHVLSWTTGSGPDVMWLSPEARLDRGKGIRGGVPVCWPWFADHPTEKALPAHGFIRTRLWSVAESGADTAEAWVRLAISAHDTGFWPFSADVSLTVTLSDGLGLELETRNTGSHAFDLTEALHTYFRVGDIDAVSVSGLEGRTYLDKLDGYARKSESAPIRIGAEVDRIYLGDTAAIHLDDRSIGRRIAVTSRGSRSAVVWNPWIAKAQRLGDMGPDAHRSMLCIETANAGDDIVRLAPGAAHLLAAHYAVVKL